MRVLTFIVDAVATECDHLDAPVTPQKLTNGSTPCSSHTRQQHALLMFQPAARIANTG